MPPQSRSGAVETPIALKLAQEVIESAEKHPAAWKGDSAQEKVILALAVVKLATPSENLPCKATPSSYGGGASCDQKWTCEECGDVTDTDRCPKGRQNETLAALATPSSALPLLPGTPRTDAAIKEATDSSRPDLLHYMNMTGVLNQLCRELEMELNAALAPASAKLPCICPTCGDTIVRSSTAGARAK